MTSRSIPDLWKQNILYAYSSILCVHLIETGLYNKRIIRSCEFSTGMIAVVISSTYKNTYFTYWNIFLKQNWIWKVIQSMPLSFSLYNGPDFLMCTFYKVILITMSKLLFSWPFYKLKCVQILAKCVHKREIY